MDYQPPAPISPTYRCTGVCFHLPWHTLLLLFERRWCQLLCSVVCFLLTVLQPVDALSSQLLLHPHQPLQYHRTRRSPLLFEKVTSHRGITSSSALLPACSLRYFRIPCSYLSSFLSNTLRHIRATCNRFLCPRQYNASAQVTPVSRLRRLVLVHVRPDCRQIAQNDGVSAKTY